VAIDQHQLYTADWGDPSIIEIGGHPMNATLLTADRNTHIKIVAMGLSAALMIALASLVAH
jgi:hypothetical protein